MNYRRCDLLLERSWARFASLILLILIHFLSVYISIYTVLGQLVRELTDRGCAPGMYPVRWDGTDSANRPVSSGVYVVRMTTDVEGGTAIDRKILVVR